MVNKIDKFTDAMFSINVLVGFIGFGYFAFQFIGYWSMVLTPIYAGIVIIGIKPTTREEKKMKSVHSDPVYKDIDTIINEMPDLSKKCQDTKSKVKSIDYTNLKL